MELKDVQNKQDKRGIDIQKVGIKDVQVPLLVQRKNDKNQIVNAKARMSVSLDKNFKGTHMSRFMEVLDEYSKNSLDLQSMLESLKKKLSAKSAEVKFNFVYFIKKKAPVSKMDSMMGYDCFFKAKLKQDGEYKFYLGVKVPVTTLCPCSKEISEFGAHNQRAIISLIVTYDKDSHIWIEDIVNDIEKCGSSPVYSLLKRRDEKYVTEQAYNNPKFVEDVLRDVVLTAEKYDNINSYEVEIEAFESIHNHSAWAYQKKELKEKG